MVRGVIWVSCTLPGLNMSNNLSFSISVLSVLCNQSPKREMAMTAILGSERESLLSPQSKMTRLSHVDRISNAMVPAVLRAICDSSATMRRKLFLLSKS